VGKVGVDEDSEWWGGSSSGRRNKELVIFADNTHKKQIMGNK
jgi:hypothetical protein